MEFFTIVFLSWWSVSEKSSTKNPDLNLFNPSTSVICIFKVLSSNKDNEV